MLSMPDSRSLCVVVPTLNERKNLSFLVRHIERISAQQLVIVDGGSTDGSLEWLTKHWHDPEQQRFLIETSAGRAKQMNAGARVANTDMIVFLHADTRLPEQAALEIINARDRNYFWGRFDVQFEPASIGSAGKGALFNWMMSVVAVFINIRSRLSSIATGDQAIFVDRNVFNVIGGFPSQPLMEDIAISKLLKRQSVPFCSYLKVHTSARRWQQYGVVKTVILMWLLRLAYFFGASPNKLTKIYRQSR